LRIRLDSFSAPRHTAAIDELCQALNDTRTVYPGTDLTPPPTTIPPSRFTDRRLTSLTRMRLQWLRDELSDASSAGAVVHAGPRLHSLTERILAAPICSIWA
jgi:hypothetical protein